jgi:hypothetical protein
MGANEWRGASSIDDMSNDHLKLYLTTDKFEGIYSLKSVRPVKTDFLFQEVDFANRETSNNNYYPDPIIREEMDMSNGFNYISEPFEESILVNGSFIGELKVSINKNDFDYGVTLYEVTPNGEFFHLSYIIGRASYANDITHRKLLQPNKIETISFSNTHLISKKLSIGSRLLVYINVNKNPFSELNYGTGNEVSEETMSDAKQPLKVKWYNDSFVEIPIWKDKIR